jgi:UDP-glucose 4-epimerase
MSYQGVKVMVTGADGFIGSHLTEALLRSGAKVTAISQYNSFDSHGWLDDLPEEARGKLRIVRGDVRDAAFMRRVMQEQETVFHLAALIAIPQSYVTAQAYIETNVLGTLNVLEAARDCGTKRIIHTSTSEVYGTVMGEAITEDHPLQGQSPYSASKIGADMMAEAFARSFDLPVATLRPFNTFGPRQSERAIIPTIIRQALDPNCAAILVGDTTPMRDLTFVQDTAAAFMALGSAPNITYGRPYNAGNGRAVSVSELISLIVELTECNKPVVQDTQRFRPVNSEVRALLADSTRITAETGWTPHVTLIEGLVRTIDWWRGRLRSGLVRKEKSYML